MKLRPNDIVTVRGSFEGIENFRKKACVVCEACATATPEQ